MFLAVFDEERIDLGSFSLERFGLRGCIGSTFSKIVQKLGTRICPKFMNIGPNRIPEREIGHLLVQNSSQRVCEGYGHAPDS